MIRFQVEGDLAGILECNCSICHQSGYLHWMIKPEQLKLQTPLLRQVYTNGEPVLPGISFAHAAVSQSFGIRVRPTLTAGIQSMFVI
jgi:hypothetical protein